MSSRFFAFAAATIVAVTVGATSGCLTATNPSIPAADTVCKRGALKVGDSLSYIFDAANGCRTVDLFSSETTFANSFSLSLTAGTGYLITMGTTDSNPYLRPSLELTRNDSSKQLLAYDSYYWRQQAALVFVADSTVNYAVRAATVDTLAGDLGQYFIKMQQCRVPSAMLVASTDALTHSDSLTKSDCLMPLSDFNSNDSSRVQLYSMHMDAGQARTLTYSASQPLVILIGPTYDTFASLSTSFGADSINSQSGSLEFSPGANARDYTVVVGTYAFSTASVPYSLSIGAEHAPTMQRMRLRRSLSKHEAPIALSARRRPCCLR